MFGKNPDCVFCYSETIVITHAKRQKNTFSDKENVLWNISTYTMFKWELDKAFDDRPFFSLSK